MAKELPYFKFEPSQWDTGNIQLCSFEVQGVFINICSMYWQRLGDLPYELALRKVCAGNATALDSLCASEIVAVEDGHLRIEFLDEQLAEFENTSKVNSKNAREGWEKRRKTNKNATPLRPHSDPNAIRGEKRREENTQSVYDSLVNAFDTIYIDQEKTKWSHIDFDFEFETFQSKVRGSPDRYKGRDAGSLRLALQAQLRVAKSKPKPPAVKENKYEQAEINKSLWTIEAWETEYGWALKRDHEFRKHFGYDELRISKAVGGNSKS